MYLFTVWIVPFHWSLKLVKHITGNVFTFCHASICIFNVVPRPSHFTYTKYLYCGNLFRRKESNGIPLLLRETFQNHPAVNTEKSALSSIFINFNAWHANFTWNLKCIRNCVNSEMNPICLLLMRGNVFCNCELSNL